MICLNNEDKIPPAVTFFCCRGRSLGCKLKSRPGKNKRPGQQKIRLSGMAHEQKALDYSLADGRNGF